MAKLSRSAFISMLGGTGVFLLTGCGSGTKKNSNYGGVYRAAYSIPQLGESGYFNFTVDVKGQLQGSLDNQNGKVREFTGELKNNGEFNGSTLNRTTGMTGFISGKMAAAGGEAATTATAVTGGNFSLVENAVTAPGDFTVGGTPTPIASPSPIAPNTFANAYSGTYYVPERSESGSVSFTVDSAGAILGFLNQNANEPVGLFQGTVSNTGNFTGTITYNNVTEAKYQARTISGTIATAIANEKRVANFVQTVSVSGGGTELLPGNMVLSITSTEPDTEYRGSFSSDTTVDPTFFISSAGTPPPGTVPTGGHFAMTVDKQGNGVGTLGNAILRISITNDGRFSGTLNNFTVSGKLSKQVVPFRVIPASTPGGAPITESSPGLAGIIEINVNGTIYVGSLFGGGGFTSGT